MRYRTFQVTGIEVLQLGCQHAESNAWPAKHWRENKGRLRLFTTAIDEQVSAALVGRSYGGPVEGIVVALEIADFAAWPPGTFAKKDSTTSYKPSSRDLWSFAKLDWRHIQYMTISQQFSAYSEAVLKSLRSFEQSKRKPKGFAAQEFMADLDAILSSLKPSKLTRAAHQNSLP
jgi:hypothetical protein